MAVIAHRRPFQRPIRRFQVLGERSSGTNLADVLLRRNTTLERTEDYGWKHAFPQFSSVLRDDLLVVCFRDARAWLKSMYQKPWHVPDKLTDIGFSDFLRAPWITVMDMPGAMNAVGRRQSRGLPVQGDRHPLTGLPAENPIRLRNLKTAAFLGILERGCNVALIRHEDLTRDPDGVLRALGRLFDIGIAAEPVRLPQKRLGEMTQRQISGPHRDAVPQFSPDDLAFLTAELDHAQEARLGYPLA